MTDLSAPAEGELLRPELAARGRHAFPGTDGHMAFLSAAADPGAVDEENAAYGVPHVVGVEFPAGVHWRPRSNRRVAAGRHGRPRAVQRSSKFGGSHPRPTSRGWAGNAVTAARTNRRDAQGV